MLFSSISFLFYFLPIVLGLYFLSPWKMKNGVLLLASLFFYFYGEPKYSLLMVFSIISGYFHGLWIDGARGGRYSKIPLISSVISCIGLLMFFKYTDFFIVNINGLFKSNIPLTNILLPIGISFYSFQILSYLIDVYKGEAEVQKNILNFAAYVSLFPQLIAGPIVRYTTIEKELHERTHTISDTAYGINRFIIGLAKKVIIANTLGELVEIYKNSGEKTVLSYWVMTIAFMLQIYFDFSAYSDMAIGLGRIFGFHFLENFNYPFISKSISEFWRRWHMSLGTWFRDYVYIPLGGSRVNNLKWIRNIIVVWFLTGFWHGAQWNFIIWGLYFAVLLFLEKQFINKLLDKLPDFLKHIYMLFFITLSFVIFNGNSLGESINNLKGMFGLLNVPLYNISTVYYIKSYLIILIIAIAGATPLVTGLVKKAAAKNGLEKVIAILEPAMHVALLLLVTGYLIDGSFNPFLYFRF